MLSLTLLGGWVDRQALKGLIRLQALVRGQLVRRQAAITLRTMEAIVRVQALFRGRRVRMSKDGRAVKTRISRIQRLSSRVKGVPTLLLQDFKYLNYTNWTPFSIVNSSESLAPKNTSSIYTSTVVRLHSRLH